jgi:hypothetical protein
MVLRMWSRLFLVTAALTALSTVSAQFSTQLERTAPSEGFVTESQSLNLLEGWIEANDGTFHSPLDLCILKEDRSSKAFAALLTLEDALKAAQNIQRNLEAQKLGGVQLEVIPRPDQFALLVRYDYQAEGRPHRARQLYLSQDGKLKTLTGSSEVPQPDSCVLEMERFLKLKGY